MNRPDGKPVSSYVAECWERVKEAPLPAFALLVPGSTSPAARTEQKRRLAALCFEMARTRPNGWFGLAQIDAAALLGVDQSRVSDYLREFVQLGLIVRVGRGSRVSGRASSYEWVYREGQPLNHQRPAGKVAARPPVPQRSDPMTADCEVRLSVAVALIRAAGGDAWANPERIADAVGTISEKVLRPEPVSPATPPLPETKPATNP